jgi:hypothetical protein
MRGRYFWGCWAIISLTLWTLGFGLGAVIAALMGILDAIVQFSCGIWKRLDTLIKLQEVKK